MKHFDVATADFNGNSFFVKLDVNKNELWYLFKPIFTLRKYDVLLFKVLHAQTFKYLPANVSGFFCTQQIGSSF